MVQIEKRKKKGRPSKADLQARGRAAVVSTAEGEDSEQQREIRRSLRRRSFRYNIIDYDEDYLDDDDELFDGVEEEEEEKDGDDDEDDEERREKKVKLVVKLNSGEKTKVRRRRTSRGGESVANRPGRRGRGAAASRYSDEDSEDERVVKKRRISGRDDDEDDGDDVDEDGEDDEEDDVDDDVEIHENGRDRKTRAKREDDDNDVPGTPTTKGNDDDDEDKMPMPTPLPNKKQLEIILDKLQKKDTYGVYAEPVDPDELPDYHEVIEHPMDFSTVRTKLADGSYSTLEEFESDVFLISSNAMQYNAPDTIYHKQARIIKELAEKKFQRLRIRIERMEQESKAVPKSEPKPEIKIEQKDRPCSLLKKLTKKPFSRNTLEPVGSDFTSGASLASADAHNVYKVDHAGNLERPTNSGGPTEGVSSLADNIYEKAEDPQSVRGVFPKFGRRSFVIDENRRGTYNISNQPLDRSDSIFTTFEDDQKQLIPVGVSGEFSYTRSLARFAANLGPPAWEIASKMIRQILPSGYKYGRGWIGEYEPLPTAVFLVEKCKNPFVSRPHDVVDSSNHNRIPEGQLPANPHLFRQPSSDGKCATVANSGGMNPPTAMSTPQHFPIAGASGGPANMIFKRVGSSCSSANSHNTNSIFQHQGKLPRDTSCSEPVGARRQEPVLPSISDHKQDNVHQREIPLGVKVGARRAEPNLSVVTNQRTDNLSRKQPHMEMVSRQVESAPMDKNFLQSLPFKQSGSNGGIPTGLANGKKETATDSIRVSASSLGTLSSQPAGALTSYPQRQNQGLSDPVQVMKMLNEKANRQQNGSAHPHNSSVARPSLPSPRVDAGGNAAAAAASAWMSVGAMGFRPAAASSATHQIPVSVESLHNGTRVFYPQAMPPHIERPVSATMHFQPEKKGLPFQSFSPQSVKGNYEAQVQNKPMGFPQLVTSDLSRFQMQAHWQGLSPHTQQKQKQDTLPPDLNVAFQSPVDSQQPDLALQL